MMYFVQKSNIKPYFKNKGMSLAEYGLIMGLVVIVAIPALTLMGGQTRDSINQVSQNSNQLNDMVNVLNAPVNGGTADQNNTSQENAFVNPNSSSLTLGGQDFGYQIGSDGKIRFTAKSANATNTTAVEGSQMTQMVLAELQQILSNPTESLNGEKKGQLQKLIDIASKIAEKQKLIDQASFKGQDLSGILDESLDKTEQIVEDASAYFSGNEKILLLAKAITTISKQNYLRPELYSKEQLNPAKLNEFNKELTDANIPSSFLLTNISKEANHTDTQAATNQLETLNTASGG